MWKGINRACGRTARWLDEYIDGTLPLPRRRTVEAHLRSIYTKLDVATRLALAVSYREHVESRHAAPAGREPPAYDAALEGRSTAGRGGAG